jgi:hypothetical protein
VKLENDFLQYCFQLVS